MAISKLEIGVEPLGEGGDSLRSAASKINSNFTDQSNAASRLVGEGANQVPLSGELIKIIANRSAKYKNNESDINLFERDEEQTVYLGLNRPKNGSNSYYITTKLVYDVNSHKIWRQWAYGEQECDIWMRNLKQDSPSSAIIYSEWIPSTQNKSTYVKTTASGANVSVSNKGELMRSTSSERYKNILAPLELDDETYANAMSLHPIVYRSTADADNPDYHYYSFSAEALGAYDPAFVLWRNTEMVTDDKGNTSEQPLTERIAEGINLNGIVAFLHATNVKQGKLISELEQRLSILEAKAKV